MLFRCQRNDNFWSDVRTTGHGWEEGQTFKQWLLQLRSNNHLSQIIMLISYCWTVWK
ncbi:hypothetical protein LINPERHAP1_LOCUS28576, partial [Linum perenne]